MPIFDTIHADIVSNSVQPQNTIISFSLSTLYTNLGFQLDKHVNNTALHNSPTMLPMISAQYEKPMSASGIVTTSGTILTAIRAYDIPLKSRCLRNNAV